MWGDFQLTEPGQLVERVKRFLADDCPNPSKLFKRTQLKEIYLNNNLNSLEGTTLAGTDVR